MSAWSSHDGFWVLAAAAVLALAAVAIYLREPAPGRKSLPKILPLLRGAAVFLLVILLLEPIWLVEKASPERGRILLLLDRSTSLDSTDPDMADSRRSKLAASTGLSPGDLGSMSRGERLRRSLLDNDHGLLAPLRMQHDVEIYSVGAEVQRLDDSTAKKIEGARSPRTDLAIPLQLAAESKLGGLPDVVVLASDGRHWGDGAPIDAARRLGALGVPIHTVGFGSAAEPIDIAVVDVRVAPTTHIEDPTSGTVVLKARVVRDRTVRASIHSRDSAAGPGQQLWSGRFEVPASRELSLIEREFEIPAFTLQEGRHELVLEIAPLPDESTSVNNERVFLVTAARRDVRVLLVDGRPRWVTRYLKNLFEKDERIHANVIFSGVDPDGPSLPRGAEDGQFPDSEERLGEYDVLFLGDIARQEFREPELEWMRDFVAKQGGALVLLAGRFGLLRSFVDSALDKLIPVELSTEAELPGGSAKPLRLSLTPLGASVPALRFTKDRDENRGMWELLRPPYWVGRARALAGTETWVETREDLIPVIVRQSYGLGQVLYVGFEDPWRWRYKVEDRYTQRFWGQIVDHFRAETFAAGDSQFSLDTDAALYKPGQSARLRVRLRRSAEEDASARVFVDVLRRDESIERVWLESTTNEPGIFEARTQALEAGSYLLQAGEKRATAETRGPELPILVAADTRRETLFRSWDEKLLRSITEVSGGGYFREEDVANLEEALRPVSRITVETEAVELSRSAGWFALLIFLFTLEWILRKRLGLL